MGRLWQHWSAQVIQKVQALTAGFEAPAINNRILLLGKAVHLAAFNATADILKFRL